ncbi:hypothetical protein [Pseudomonas sp. Irchel s3f7]|uniref:DUF6941 family protein n=1 Tax=Pseudomonas sp. Irchel s3f7 TaxID=2009153 RepID=UPI000BA3D028|nr:hypothetical protein [Pseudomonas sp. Irchel s3f7]
MTRYVHSTYCDDIRQEVGGKITLVGIYAGQCLVPEIPCSLPKLCLVLNISATRAAPVTSLTVVGAFAGTEVFTMALDKSQIEEIMAQSMKDRPDSKSMMLMLMGVMSPFNVPAEGKLTLSVIANGEELYCEGLDISKAPPNTLFGQ